MMGPARGRDGDVDGRDDRGARRQAGVERVATLRGALTKRAGRVATIALLVAVGSGSRRALRAGLLVPRSRFQSVRVAPPRTHGASLSTVIWMVRPERWLVTPYSALPLRLSGIH